MRDAGDLASYILDAHATLREDPVAFMTDLRSLEKGWLERSGPMAARGPAIVLGQHSAYTRARASHYAAHTHTYQHTYILAQLRFPNVHSILSGC